MCRSCRGIQGGALGALLALTLPAAAPAQAPSTATLARLTLVQRQVEHSGREAKWQKADEGGALRIGEAVRVGSDSLARLDLPWMALTLSAATTVRFPDEYVLSAILEGGRALLDSRQREALKLVTAEAEVRGEGRAVVRREGNTTLVTCIAGRFFVEGGGRTVVLPAGRGTVVRAGRAPTEPQPAPEPPPGAGLWPGRDPVYVAPGDAIELKWRGGAASYQIELLPVGSETVLIQRDVGAPPTRLEIPWSGAFRWRVSSRDGRGLEGPPSDDGLICVELR